MYDPMEHAGRPTKVKLESQIRMLRAILVLFSLLTVLSACAIFCLTEKLQKVYNQTDQMQMEVLTGLTEGHARSHTLLDRSYRLAHYAFKHEERGIVDKYCPVCQGTERHQTLPVETIPVEVGGANPERLAMNHEEIMFSLQRLRSHFHSGSASVEISLDEMGDK